MDAKMEHVKVVTQRMSSSKLLVDATKDSWAHTQYPGLVFHVSFTKACPTDKDLKPLCKSLLTSNLSTVPNAGGWQKDHSDASSIIENSKQGQGQSIVIIPQASLTTKLIPGDKYLKYHNQCDKANAEILYRKFQQEMKLVIKDLLSLKTVEEIEKEKLESAAGGGKKVDVSSWKERQKQNVVLDIPPEKYFIRAVEEEFKNSDNSNGTVFQSFKEDGFPLTDIEGNDIAKSRQKKLVKMWTKYQDKWKKQWANSSGNGGGGNSKEQKKETDEESKAVAAESKSEALEESKAVEEAKPLRKPEKPMEEEKPLDLSTLIKTDENYVLPEIIAGTFGARQGFEMISSGPFTHAFSF